MGNHMMVHLGWNCKHGALCLVVMLARDLESAPLWMSTMATYWFYFFFMGTPAVSLSGLWFAIKKRIQGFVFLSFCFYFVVVVKDTLFYLNSVGLSHRNHIYMFSSHKDIDRYLLHSAECEEWLDSVDIINFIVGSDFISGEWHKASVLINQCFFAIVFMLNDNGSFQI